MSWKPNTATATETKTETKVAADDLDDVIELASRMMLDEEGALTADEVNEVAAELDIPEEYIVRARAQLQEVKAEKARALAQKKRRKMMIVGFGVGVILVTSVMVVGTNSSVAKIHQAVQAQRSQVENVKDRQRVVIQQFEGRPDSPDKDAEIIGAQNRVRVETKRYIDIATVYNQKVSSFPASFTLMFSGMPSEMPTHIE